MDAKGTRALRLACAFALAMILAVAGLPALLGLSSSSCSADASEKGASPMPAGNAADDGAAQGVAAAPGGTALEGGHAGGPGPFGDASRESSFDAPASSQGSHGPDASDPARPGAQLGGAGEPGDEGEGRTGGADAQGAPKALEDAGPKAVDVGSLRLDPVADQRYANRALEPDVVLRTAGGETLAKGRDYELSYEDNVRAGTASITVSGRGGYAGTRTTTFEITPNLANLVLVVRFQGDTVGDGDTGLNAPYPYKPEKTVFESYEELYNNPEPRFVPAKNYFGISMRGYLYASSLGAADTLSYFPQAVNGGRNVAYITLDRPRSFYDRPSGTADYSLFNDTLEKFAQAYPDFDPTLLDPSGDGTVENVTIIPDVGGVAPDRGSALYPHKGSLGGSGLAVGAGSSRKLVADVNVDDTLTVSQSQSRVITHEFIHSLGIYDYYRNDATSTTGQPVGNWDIMSTRALIYPMAVTRQDIGWTTIDEADRSGRITLSELSTKRQQAVMFKSPLSDSEYFVAEYRKKDDYTQIDGQLTGSGVIVYRVNPAYRDRGNWGKDDYVYIFRQGETGLGDAAGDVNDAQISLEGGKARTSVGSSDMGKGVEDGAIVLSDGRNTGIVVSAVEEGPDSVTIDLSLPSISQDDLWAAEAGEDGSAQFGDDAFDVGTVSDGASLYSFVQQGSGSDASYLVMEMREDARGSRLVQLGAPISGARLTNASLALHRGSLYFLATGGEGMNQVVLKRYDAAAGLWTDVAQLTTSTFVQSPCSMASVAGSLYVLVGTLKQPSIGQGEPTQVYRIAEGPDGTGAFEKAGGPLAVNYVRGAQILEFGGAPLVVCGDNNAQGASKTSLLRLTQDGTWSKLDLPDSPQSADSVDAAVHGGKLYLLVGFGNQEASDPAPRLYVVAEDGRVEGNCELPWLRNGLRGASAMEVGGDHLYVAAVMRQGPVDVAKVYAAPLFAIGAGQQDLSSLDRWQQLGQTAYSPVERVSAALKGGRMYVGAINATTKRAVFVSHALLPDQTVISVTMPSSVEFSIGSQDDGSTALSTPDGQRPATFSIRNNSSSPVRAYVSSVSVSGAQLAGGEQGLSASRSLLLGMGDVAGGAFAGWLPAASEGAGAGGFEYYPFNQDGKGLIEGDSSSAAVGLFGKLGARGWEAGAQFTVTPTFTVALAPGT